MKLFDPMGLASDHGANADLLALGATILNLPGSQLVEGLRSGNFKEDLGNILHELGADASAAKGLLEELGAGRGAAGDSLHELRSEYTRLFASPEGAVANPNEGVFRILSIGGRTQPTLHVSAAAQRALAHYRDAGLQPAEGKGASPDHMRLELLFLRELEIRLSAVENQADSVELVGQAMSFWEDCLGAWGQPFFRLVASEARLPLYRVMGLVMESFLGSYGRQLEAESKGGYRDGRL